MKPETRSSLAVAAITSLLCVVAIYALLRGYDVAFKSEPNPATVIWSPKIAMFWRLGIGAYVAGPVGVAAFFAARASFERTLALVSRALVVVAGAILVQGLFLP